MNHDREVLERINELLKVNNIQQQELIEYLDLAKGTYSNWRRMTSNSYLSYLGEISDFFHVNPNYLITGKMDFKGDAVLYALNDDEVQIVNIYRRIDAKNKQFLTRILSAASEKM